MPYYTIQCLHYRSCMSTPTIAHKQTHHNFVVAACASANATHSGKIWGLEYGSDQVLKDMRLPHYATLRYAIALHSVALY